MEKEKKKVKAVKATEVPVWQELTARWLGYILLFAAGYSLVVGIIGWLMPPVQQLLSSLLFFVALPAEFSVFNAIVLFILATAVRHRIKLALWIEVIYFQLAFVVLGSAFLGFYFTGILSPSDLTDVRFSNFLLVKTIFGVLISLIVAILLVLSRKAFPTKIINGAWLQALTISVSGFILSIIGGFLVSLITYQSSVSFSHRLIFVLKDAISDFRYMLPFGAKFISYHSANNIWICTTVSVIMLLGFVTAFYVFTRSKQRDLTKNADRALAVRTLILEEVNDDSLAYFATRTDKAVVFSKNGKAAIAYNLFGSVLLASGDPIGKKSAWKNAGENFLTIARTHGWTPAVVGASQEAAEFYRQIGLTATTFGDEAVVIVKDFSIKGKGMHDVAQVMRRAAREKYTVKIRRQAEIPADELSNLTALTENWRDGEERGFSMATSRFGEEVDQQMVIVTAYDETKNVMGILSFVPVGFDKLSLDTMRRNPAAMNGVTTFMIASLIETGKEMGITEVSLNFAAARHFFVRGEEVHANVTDRAMRHLMLFFSRWYQLESLYRSNDIYQPEWRTRYICYAQGASLTAVLFAIGQAEGFVSLDIFTKIRKLFRKYNHEEKWWKNPDYIAAVHKAEAEHLEKVAPKPTYDEGKLEKLHYLRSLGISAYSSAFKKSISVSNLTEQFESQEEFDETTFTLTGRLTSIRGRGAMNFSDLQDENHSIQIMLKRDTIDENADLESFEVWKKAVTTGDIIAVTGTLMKTKTGALSLKVLNWHMIAKSIAPFTEQEKEKQAQIRRQITRLTVLREKMTAANFAEAEENPLNLIAAGLERVFVLENQTLKFYTAYENPSNLTALINQIFERKLNLTSSAIIPDATIEEETVYEQALPPFALATISVDDLLAESEYADEN